MLSIDKILYGSANTRKTKMSLASNHILPHIQVWLEDHEVEEIGEEFFIWMLHRWEESELKVGTIKQLFSLLKLYIKVWTNKDYNLSRIQRTLVTPQAEVKAWTKGEAKQALAHSYHLDKELHDMILISLHTGMRKGEMFGLTWEDIDFVSGKIKITKSYKGSTKNNKARSIVMTQPVEEMLMKRYTVGGEHNLLFRICDPNPRLKQLCDIANIKKITWHGLRHTFASLALDSGMNLKSVATLMGHSKVSTLVDTYWNKLDEVTDLNFVP